MDLFEFARQLQDFDELEIIDGLLHARSHIDETPLDKPWSMTLADIAAVDIRLPVAIEAYIAHHESNNDFSNIISAPLLMETALYWTGTKLIPTDWGVLPYHKLCYFREVELAATQQKVVIVVQRCVTKPYTSKDGVQIRHIQGFGGMTRPVDIVWLDNQFPGWKQRYPVALALGYEGEELLEQVLTKEEPSESIALNSQGITFD